ncbi:hypothetical protein EYF80_016451 [Liparis tanakae]|uniref:Uncharacterized protein n=1 Tax=Liparis tanakae TaxID=230148 RepID=A0A4Z2I5Q0_9TELE|nr:hypothetical protein EYF80_016451 [Liparis tanakae]
MKNLAVSPGDVTVQSAQLRDEQEAVTAGITEPVTGTDVVVTERSGFVTLTTSHIQDSSELKTCHPLNKLRIEYSSHQSRLDYLEFLGFTYRKINK